MDEKIVTILKKLEDNKELQAKLSECKDPSLAYELLDGESAGVTLEEFKTVMGALGGNNELSDDDLNQVAGGALTENEKIIAGSVGIGIGVVTTAATAAI